MNYSDSFFSTMNFTAAVIAHIKNGFRCVSNETYYKRLGKCEECPLKQADWVCGDCKCDLLWKARWAEQECPLEGEAKKWDSTLKGKGEAQKSCCGDSQA